MLPAGGMAEVYRARNPRLDKIVAIKILRPDADADMAERFEAEAPTAARLSHPHIVNVFDTGVHEGRPYIVMEFLNGCDLSHAIRHNTIPSLAGKLKVALEIADALRYANGHGVLHRDIKPSNIYVCESGEAKLIDFGIAKSSTSPKTQVGFTLGTLRYMAPEQMHGQLSNVIDVYAFGVVLYEFLTGIHAVPGDTPAEVMRHIVAGSPDPAPLVAKGVPDSLVRLIQWCTAKAPADRPQGFAPVCEELRKLHSTLTMAQAVTTNTLRMDTRMKTAAIAAPPPPVAPPAVPAASRRRYLLYGAGGAVALALAAFALIPRQPAEAKADPPGAEVNAPRPSSLAHPRGDMVLVPAGTALIGADSHPVDVPDFYIDKTEVTARAWAEYCRTAGCSATTGDPALPATGVSYDEAAGFCQAAGKRLPTPVEWEKAARGPRGYRFPWGNAADPNRANHSGRIAAAGAYAESASPFGAVDMAGNVWEWVDRAGMPSAADLKLFQKQDPSVTGSESWRAVYGGSYSAGADKLAPMWDFALIPARWADPTVGFRCAKTPE
jgi:eukaryotic-like serine/threonine-protein kinase